MLDLNVIFAELQKADIQIDETQKSEIARKIEQVLSYEPKVGFFGKTGAGKSSLCNALFGQDTFPIDDIESCTRATQEEILKFGENKGIKLIDVPGVGENQEKDEEYSKLYNQLLPELDLVLWLIKADDRAISIDLNYYENIVKPHIDQGKPFFFVLSQADKIEPCREWNFNENMPGTKQHQNIIAKCRSISHEFSCSPSLIIPVSAKEKFNLNYLVQQIILELPKEKRFTVYREIPEQFRDQDTDKVVQESIMDTIVEIVDAVVKVGKIVVDVIVPVVTKIIGAIFSFFG